MAFKTTSRSTLGTAGALRRKDNRFQESAPQRRFSVSSLEPLGKVAVKADADGSLQVIARLTGLQPHDVDIQVMDGALTLLGERRKHRTRLPRRRNRRSRDLGPFRHTFALPTGVSRDQVKTRIQGDVLTVTIPRSA